MYWYIQALDNNIIQLWTLWTFLAVVRSVSQVAVGEHDLGYPDDHVVIFDVSRSVIHEGYDPNYLDNDIAILNVAGTIEFDDSAQPICPPSRNRDGYAGLLTTVTGWGYDGNGE